MYRDTTHLHGIIDFHEFEASLVYRASFRTARATQRNSVSKQINKQSNSFEMLYIEIHIAVFSLSPTRLSKPTTFLSPHMGHSPKLKAFIGINKVNLQNWSLFRYTKPRAALHLLGPELCCLISHSQDKPKCIYKYKNEQQKQYR